MINNPTYPPIEIEYGSRKDPSKVATCKAYVNKFEKHILEWEHDDYTQVEINEIIALKTGCQGTHMGV